MFLGKYLRAESIPTDRTGGDSDYPDMKLPTKKPGPAITSFTQPLRATGAATHCLRRVTVGPILGNPARLRRPSAQFAVWCKFKKTVQSECRHRINGA